MFDSLLRSTAYASADTTMARTFLAAFSSPFVWRLFSLFFELAVAMSGMRTRTRPDRGCGKARGKGKENVWEERIQDGGQRGNKTIPEMRKKKLARKRGGTWPVLFGTGRKRAVVGWRCSAAGWVSLAHALATATSLFGKSPPTPGDKSSELLVYLLPPPLTQRQKGDTVDGLSGPGLKILETDVLWKIQVEDTTERGKSPEKTKTVSSHVTCQQERRNEEKS